MEYLAEQISDHFLAYDGALVRELGILAIVLSGSVAYCHAECSTLSQARDFDGAILVNGRADITRIMDDKRTELKTLLAMQREEDLAWDLSTHDLQSVDGVRFAGWTSDNVKLSYKILSFESFTASPGVTNLLSRKDRRVYEGYTSEGLPTLAVQQATKIENDTVVLHDDWILHSTFFLPTGSRQNSIIFGVTADLLLTGYWLGDLQNTGEIVRGKLISYASAKCGTNIRPVFAGAKRFQPIYRAWLNDQLSQNADFDVLGTPSPETQPPVRISIGSSIEQRRDQQFGRSGPATKVMAMRDDEPSPCKIRTIEKQRLENLKVFYPFIHKPLNLNPVRKQSHLYIEYMNGASQNDLKAMFDIELRKAEDTLSAYRASLQSRGCKGYPADEWQIHRIFWLRLAHEKLFASWYKSGIFIDNQLLPLQQFVKLKLCVNGKRYGCFEDLHAIAQEALNPSTLSGSPIVFGLGDGHGGNVMISSETSPLPGEKLSYIDYEVSGFHSPFLDLAKPLYNDVFFAALDSRFAPANFSVKARLENGCLLIDTSCQRDSLALGILRIKRHFLIEPLCKTLVENSVDMESGVRILVNALFTCALLTHNFVGEWDQLFLNLAVGTSLLSCRTFEDVWQTCTALLTTPANEARPVCLGE